MSLAELGTELESVHSQWVQAKAALATLEVRLAESKKNVHDAVEALTAATTPVTPVVVSTVTEQSGAAPVIVPAA